MAVCIDGTDRQDSVFAVTQVHRPWRSFADTVRAIKCARNCAHSPLSLFLLPYPFPPVQGGIPDLRPVKLPAVFFCLFHDIKSILIWRVTVLMNSHFIYRILPTISRLRL